ncbi:two-component system sensor histidine kinase NtrB [Sphingomonas radiodurans]|uniref:two-component system sensor histidine kinase NtrB n=1 Tax=Sphingomonas radiodurans TaxID=2890321 RepID=UPI001E2EC77A|nr:PAS domain-containing sensor histidine kinase [Sphingomonas radiodurans]WBH17983.1 PAS domain-containing protein [Sphingomonas radiodurans]
MPVSAAQRFAKFFEATSDCQFYVKRDEDGRFKYVHANPAALAVVGRSTEDELLGLTPVEVMGEEYGKAVEYNISEAFHQGRPYHFSGALGTDGSGRVYDAYYYPLIDESGSVAGVLGSARDITDIKSLNERLLHAQRLEALGELSGSVAHDFNNVLTILQIALRNIGDENIDRAKRDMILDEAQKAIDNGAALTRRLTSFARKEKLNPVPHDVDKLVSSCRYMMQRALGKRIRLRFDLSSDLWKACCDKNEFEIAMMNLAANARDAIDGEGEVVISAKNMVRATSAPLHYPEQYVEVTMRDTGNGMSPEVARNAILPFFSTKPDGKGTGLGLSSIAKFVNDIGGAINVESALGVGTSVSLLLPREAI